MPLLDTKRRHHYRLLAVSDKVEPRIYGPNLRLAAPNVDFIVSCGDLPYYYLDYIVSVLDRPLYYVHGNHDRPEHRASGQVAYEPTGGVNLHHGVRLFSGLLIAGLEGSHRYNRNDSYQYTQGGMWSLVLRLCPSLIRNQLLYGRGLDILITHSPPFGIHDAADQPHIGFRAFNFLIRQFKPRYVFHGHQHIYSQLETTRTQYEATAIVNVYPFRILDLDFS